MFNVKDRVVPFLQSKGLEASDVPKVLGTFITLKYATWTAFVIIGARYQPLSKLFRQPTRAAWSSNTSVRWREAAAQSRVGAWYRETTQRLAGRLGDGGNSRMLEFISRACGVKDARYLALGMAEGMILYKLTFPVHGPAEFLLSAEYYRQRNLQQLQQMLEDYEMWRIQAQVMEDLRELQRGVTDVFHEYVPSALEGRDLDVETQPE